MSAAFNSRGAKKWQSTLWVEDLQAADMSAALESPLEREGGLITGVLLAGVVLRRDVFDARESPGCCPPGRPVGMQMAVGISAFYYLYIPLLGSM